MEEETEKIYTIPESQLFRLLTACSKLNRCANRWDKCECNSGIPKTPKRQPKAKK